MPRKVADDGLEDSEVQDLVARARKILRSEEYWEGVEHRVSTMELDPQIERMLWAYGVGSPVPMKTAVTKESPADLQRLREMSREELARHAEQLAGEIRSRREEYHSH